MGFSGFLWASLVLVLGLAGCTGSGDGEVLARPTGAVVAPISPTASSGSDSGSPGASVPWTTYEAEAMTTDGQVLGPGWLPGQADTEASGRRCVRLTNAGAFVEFTATAPGEGLVVRYSLADAPQGGGTRSTLEVRVNGALVRTLAVDSRLAWSYGRYPFTDDPAAGAPRGRYDEVRALIPTVHPGDRVRLVKPAAEGWCDLDLVDLEPVAPPIEKPAQALAVTDFGAVADDGRDDAPAFRACLAEARRRGVGAWIPRGEFQITGTLRVEGTSLEGAGMWHSRLVGDPDYGTVAKRLAIHGSSGIRLGDFAVIGGLTYRRDDEPNDGLGESFGTGSVIRNLWIEHTKTGAWITNTEGLRVTGCRFRNTIADGLNLSVGTRDCTVEHCTTRGTGDDGFALWPATYKPPAFPAGGNRIHHCTARMPLLGNGIGLYGGAGNRVEDCLVEDAPHGCGILVSTAFGGIPFSGTTRIERCRLIRAGGYDYGGPGDPEAPGNAHHWRGSLHVMAVKSSISGLEIRDLEIRDSASDGVSFNSAAGMRLEGAVLERLTITGAGQRGQGFALRVWSDARGEATVRDLVQTGAASGRQGGGAPGFLLRDPGNSRP